MKMNQFERRLAVVAVLLFCGNIVTTAFADHRRARVPATLEIEILDPGVDPVGNPAVMVGPDGPDGRQVDIPPTVLVHRYYYTGDRRFQGPLLPGGPSIIVVTHPYTHERMYVEANLLPGAPRVCYTASTIEYDYGNRGMTLSFKRRGIVTVSYRNYTPAGRIVGKGVAGVGSAGVSVLERAGVIEAAHTVKETTVGAAGLALDGIREGRKIIMAPLVNVAENLPVVNPAMSLVRDKSGAATRNAMQKRDSAVNRAQRDFGSLDETIPTVR
ncbi:MAG: hypothetical protein WEB58_14215 [Planctomycetaceae bacterium]